MRGKHKICFIFFLVFFLLLSGAPTSHAITNPLDSPNNRFGIHITDENDLTDAANLVNSEGGGWGYITFVIREDERNITRWQRAFDTMRRLHLIPIVRVATKQEDESWTKPQMEEINNWIAFLNSLNWVIQNRYVIVGNEPNHATEWGREVNPEEYSDYLIEFSKKLRGASNDFFILPAGFDASAPTDSKHLSESVFLKRMFEKNEDVFDYVDGWTSHSYPNPNFSGSENSSGRGTIKTYEWELQYLKNLGVSKTLPVFITETGWAHNMENGHNGYKHTDLISDKITTAFTSAWNADYIVAITPFILNYQDEPFNIFSWKRLPQSNVDMDETENLKPFYDFYYDIQKLSKIKGAPKQVNSIEIKTTLLPQMIKRGKNMFGIAYVKNTGQVIWPQKELQIVKEGEKDYEIEPISFLQTVEPNGNTLAFFKTL